MKKRTYRQWRNYLDKLAREAVRKRGRCERCGSLYNLQVAHIFSRIYKNTRWDTDNLLLLCASCHFWGHRNPLLFAEFVRERIGEERYKNLLQKSIRVYNWSEKDYIELEQKLKNYGTRN